MQESHGQGGHAIEPTIPLTPIDRTCRELAAARRDHERDCRRRLAAAYRRDVRILLAWTFPASREAVTMSEIYPECPATTRVLCRRLYRDLMDARAMPRFYRRRAMRIDSLRTLFSGECRLYADQRARADAQAAMHGFINSLAAE